ncbi:MAG: LssY C-terminal domain-containing protein [Verrucomicrobiales bacterium]|nr:LssY C-terminal domain-containing protein [Verrucomicrobiales bacterium]
MAVLSRREASRMFDLPLHKKHIQPVWLRLENNYTNAYYFLPASLDPNYFSPAEVAYMFRKTWASKRNRRVGDFMEGKSLPLLLPPHSTNDGFVFTTLDRGAKHLRVELLGEMDFRRFEFFTYAPERRFDFQRVDFQSLYPTNSIPDYTRSEVRSALESLPAAVSDRRGRGSGDPVNLVVVGDPGDIGLAFARQGWDLTEVLTFGNVFRLIGSFVFNRTWENSPISSLYLFGRRQDMALQKARATIHERNHLRLWLAPFTCEGQVVLVGQISRDIGLRFTFKAPGWVTHKIDPDVDEARDYLAQEMVTSGSVGTVTLVGGVGQASRETPQRNLTGDPFFTDGKRLVLFLSGETVPVSQIHLEDWTAAPPRPATRGE